MHCYAPAGPASRCAAALNPSPATTSRRCAGGYLRAGPAGAAALSGDLAFCVGRLRYLEGEARAEDDASWRRLDGTFTWREALAPQWELAFSARAQWGLNNLDSTQQFRLG